MVPGPDSRLAEQRILDATASCVARYGVAKTTLDDVAREAGCARATVYRYFGGKRHLLEALVDREGGALVARLAAVAAGSDTLEDALVAMATTAAAALEGDAALQFVLAHEPEMLLPALTFEGGDRFLADASDALAPVLVRFVPLERAHRAAEWCTRIFLAYLGATDAPIAMHDPRAVRELVRDFVAPALAPVATDSVSTSRG